MTETAPHTFEYEQLIFSVSRQTGEAGEHEVTGSVRFPYAAPGGKTEIAFRYRRRPLASCLLSLASVTDKRSRAVAMFHELRATAPDEAERHHHQVVAAEIGCSVSSVRLWVRSFELDGAAGLTDRYTARPRETVHLDPATARDAVIICAWWSFRCGTGFQPVDGGEPCITGPLINQAAGLLTRTIPGLIRAHRAAKNPNLLDVLAAIDAYYSYPCDRTKFPFKSFARWAKHDFSKCLYWAARRDEQSGQQYTHERPPGSFPIARDGVQPIQLQTTESVLPSDIPDARTRAREARWSQRRRAPRANPSRAREKAVSSHSPIPNLQSSISAWLTTLPDSTRVMLLAACKHNAPTDVRHQVTATLPIWWDSVPLATRNHIDFQMATWKREHPHVNAMQLAARQSALFLAAIRKEWRDAPPTLGSLMDNYARKVLTA